jgi:hypothetical protein
LIDASIGPSVEFDLDGLSQSMIGINQLRLWSAQTRVAQPPLEAVLDTGSALVYRVRYEWFGGHRFY